MAEKENVSKSTNETKATPDDHSVQTDPKKAASESFDLKNPKFPFWYPWANSAALFAVGVVAGLLAAGFLWGMEASSAVILIGGVGFGFLAQGQARPWVTWPYPLAYVEQVRAEQTKNVQQTESSVREVVDTVVFVIVLVLMLKSFVAEAFIIPTGSMADTLLGHQKQVTCSVCGYTFPVNAKSEADPEPDEDRIVWPTKVDACRCPNCRQKLKLVDYVPQEKAPAPSAEAEVKDPGWSNGDRVIVVKYIYDFQDPTPLDVVVFKYPEEPRKQLSQQNYIKRLIGLPGQTVVIRAGDIFILPASKSVRPKDSIGVDPNDLWKPIYAGVKYDEPDVIQRDRLVAPRSDARLPATSFWWKHKKDLGILRKNEDALLSMRRIVYDNNHQASNLTGEKWQRWQPEAGSLWKSDGEHGFIHAAGGQSVEWINYAHLLPNNGGAKSLITDFLGYNSYRSVKRDSSSGSPRSSILRDESERTTGDNWVGDLMIECEVDVNKAQGQLVLALNRGEDRFFAEWDLSNGTCSLYRMREGKKTPVGKPVETDLTEGSHQIRFANFDRQLTVWVDGDLPFGQGVPYKLPDSSDEGPGPGDFKPASIGVKGASVHVTNISLWRDTYYTVIKMKRHENGMLKYYTSNDRREADIVVNNWTEKEDRNDSRDWEKLRHPPACVMYVQPGHYLCLGDNSPQSSDSRAWGVVPQRLMLGQALTVYWPLDRFGRIR